VKIKTIIISLFVLTFVIGGIGTAYAVTSPGGAEVGSVPETSVLAAPAAAFTGNNVFVSIASGLVREFTPLGVPVQDIDCTSIAGLTFTTGSVFDDNMNFYVTLFTGGTVCKTNMDNTVHTSFGSGYSGSVESILFNAAGEAYTGEVDGANDIRHFTATGTPIASFNVAIEDRGADWIDLAADQCTMFYTSEGFQIKRYDVCTDTQLADFATSTDRPLYALRILPDGGVLVANTVDIKRYDSSGTEIDSYDVTGITDWFALNLDGDGTTFWSADFGTGEVCRFNIATGGGLNNQDICWNTGTGGTTVFGLSVKGEITEARCPPGTQGIPPNCTPIVDAIGGNLIPIDATMILVSGAQYTAAWMIPVIVSGIGFAIVIARKF